MIVKAGIVSPLLALALTAAAQESPLPATTAEAAGFTASGLARIDAFFDREITQKRVPGAVVAIARNGKLVYHKAFGYLDREHGKRMPLDAIFWFASMTKPMTAVGALSLTQEGRLPLRSTVATYFPGFSQMKVGVAGTDGTIRYDPQARPIYVHDLFRHTSGLTYGGRPDAGTPLANLHPPGTSLPGMASADEFIATITKLPLVYQPGTVFEYGVSIDVLGAIVEKLTSKSLGGHLSDVIWKPLNMKDTGFHVPAEKKERVAVAFKHDPLTGKPQRIRISEEDVRFECGGGCAFSTVGDYLRFAQMLANGGVLEGHRILSPEMVRLMTSNHLGREIVNRVGAIEPHREGYGFGLSVAVRTEPGLAAIPGSVGEYTWNGANGTGFFVDPQEKLAVVFATAAPGEIRKYYREQIQDLVYGAMSGEQLVTASAGEREASR